MARFALFIFFLAFPLLAQFPAIRWNTVLTGLRQPTHATNARDGSGRLFIAEQSGLVKTYWNGALLDTPFLDIRPRVNYGGELGLLSIAFPPDFSKRQHFYAYFIDKDNSSVIARYNVTEDPNVADPASEEIILRLAQPFGQHNGGLISFSPNDGMLYLATGDGGFYKEGDLKDVPDPLENAQSTGTLLGKMLRIDVESGVSPYAIPTDNPKRDGWLPEIWARGLRNPWRYAFDRANGDLYLADVGNITKEEVNMVPAGTAPGVNFGWKLREGKSCLPDVPCEEVQGLTEPVYDYDHTEGCSVIGGVVYRGQLYPDLQGAYLFADFCNAMVWGMRSTEEGWKVHEYGYSAGLPVSFAEDEDGEVYLVDWEGTLMKLALADKTDPPPTATKRPSGNRIFRRDKPTRGKPLP